MSSRKRFNKFGVFGITTANQKRFLLDSEKPKKRKGSSVKKEKRADRKEEILGKIKKLEGLKLTANQEKWINILNDACQTQGRISNNQLSLMRRLYKEIIRDKKPKADTVSDNQKAKSQVSNLLPDPNRSYDYFIYTDGSYDMDKNQGGFAFVVLNRKKEEIYRHHQSQTNSTSNRMEYMALISAMKWMDQNISEVRSKSVLVQADSQLLVNTYNSWMHSWAKDNWSLGRMKGKRNLDLVEKMYDLKPLFPLLELKWVKAHNGEPWNELVDQLAKGAYN